MATLPDAAVQRTPWGLVLFVLSLHVLNQIDRQLVAAFAADIMHDLSLNRGQFALIAGLAFSGVYALAALAAGVLAEINRRFYRIPAWLPMPHCAFCERLCGQVRCPVSDTPAVAAPSKDSDAD